MLRLAEKYGLALRRNTAAVHRIVQNGDPRLVPAAENPLGLDHAALVAVARPRRGRRPRPAGNLATADGSNIVERPDARLEQTQVLEIIEQELTRLPARQLSFIKRTGRNLDVAETAKAHGLLRGQRENALLPGGACVGCRAQGTRYHAMNETQFGNKIRHLLNQGLTVDKGAADRLRAARGRALARQRAEPAPALAWADNVLGRLGGWSGLSLRLLAPFVALVISVVAIYTWQQNQRLAEIGRSSPVACRRPADRRFSGPQLRAGEKAHRGESASQ